VTDRPPVPRPGERARTIAAVGPATVLPSTAGPAPAERIAPLLHHVHGDGSVSMLLPDDHELVATARFCGGELTTMVELIDLAPVPLREPIRGLLWITGWLHNLEAAAARQLALSVAETRPDPRLLDLGHGASLLRLVPASMVVADADGTNPVSLAEFAAAEPDPFCGQEAGWLRHLEISHTDVVSLLTRHIPEQLRGGHVRPLGLDRYGLRLRVEALELDHDVRLAFSRPITTPAELATELRRLVGCPFLAHHQR
jgi:hypothetical protein